MVKSLRDKTIAGVSWSFVEGIAGSGVTFMVGLILARILSPEEFGVIGMITIFIAISTSFVDSGFSSALIRKKDASDIDFDTVFYFNLGVSVLCYILLYAFAPYISKFFNEIQLIKITRVIGLILIINAFAVIQRTILIKRIDFKTRTKVSVISSISGGAIGIVMALNGSGVWSLVGLQLSQQLFNTLLLWVYSTWKPRWMFSWDSFQKLFAFGFKILLSGLVNTIYKHIFYLVIGRFYQASQLGQYTRAEQFDTMVSSNLTATIQRVTYPVLSSIQDDPERFKQNLRRVLKVTLLVTLTCIVGLIVMAKPLIYILIGKKWLVAAHYLQLISLAGFFFPIYSIHLIIFQIKGRSDLFLRMEVTRVFLTIIPITGGVVWGIECMLIGNIVVSIITWLLGGFYVSVLMDYSLKVQLKDIFPILSVSCVIAFCMYFWTWVDISYWLMIIIQCLTGGLVAIFMYEKTRLPAYIEVKNIVFSMLKRRGM